MTDVVVVGAGLAGLNAALHLQRAGLDVEVLEARDRVGGRIWSFDGPLGSEEAGAVNISEGYRRLQAHLRDYELALEPVRFDIRDHTLVVNGETSLASTWSNAPSNPLPEGPWRAIPPLGLLPSVFSRENPLADSRSWLAQSALDYDIPCTEYLRNRGLPDQAVPLVDRASTLQSVHEDSALNLLRAAQRMSRFSPQTSSIVNGNQRLPEAMADALHHPVRLGSVVTSVRPGEKGKLQVDLEDGEGVAAEHVVLAVPFPCLSRMELNGLLPDWLYDFATELRSTALTKFHVTVERPFWMDDELPVITWTDRTPQRLLPWRLSEDGTSSLAIWVTGWEATELDSLDEDHQVRLIKDQITAARPAIGKANLTVTKVVSWGRDPFAGGAWAMPQAGQMRLLADATQYSGGPLHLAGEHLSIEDSGLEGALETGDRVAQRIIASLR